MRVGQSRKRDANERAIIAALEAIGVRVQRVSERGFPDLVCYSREGLRLIEVKSNTGKLTLAQQAADWPCVVVRSVAEALALYGVGG